MARLASSGSPRASYALVCAAAAIRFSGSLLAELHGN